MRATLKIASAFLLVGMAFGAAPAHASCKRFGFTVNDYGKEGPIRDAKSLLDKHISSWASQQGIKDYTVGKKDVSCELFLNFIVFDEHTCTASANVCWNGDRAEGAEESGSPPAPVSKAVAKKQKATDTARSAAPARPVAAGQEITLDGRDVNPPKAPDATEEAPAEQVADESKPSPAAAAATDAAAADDAAAETKPESVAAVPGAEPASPGTPVQSENTAPAMPSVTETGTLGAVSAAATAAEKAEPQVPVAAHTPPAQESAAAAAAAAAASAAERAAAAAETAAAAAKEAAAAAIAAGAMGRGAMVPPLDAAPDKSASRANAVSGAN
ncbi:MAG TPA: hypothetical protein VGA65_01820 [Hyphomicrobium sp.]|jgi:hypothetical protein